MYKSVESKHIRNLKVIAMLKRGDRLRTRPENYSIDTYDSIFSYKPIYRYLTGESKEDTVESLNRLVETCIKQAATAPHDKKRLAEQFKSAMKGLNNLAETYKESSTVVAGLDFIKEVIEDFIVTEDPEYQRETCQVVGGDNELDIEEEEVVSTD